MRLVHGLELAVAVLLMVGWTVCNASSREKRSGKHGGGFFTCTKEGQQFRYQWNKCKYYECKYYKQGPQLFPDVKDCPPGKSVPLNFVGGFEEGACTQDDRTCVGDMEQTTIDDMSDSSQNKGPAMLKTIPVKFKVKGENVQLDLQRNDDVDPNAKIFVGEKGSIKEYVQNETADFAFYYDKEKGASMAVWKVNQAGQRKPKHKLRGDFVKDNKRYIIQPRTNDRANDRSSDLIIPDEDLLPVTGVDEDDAYIIYEDTPIDRELKPDSIMRDWSRSATENDQQFSEIMEELNLPNQQHIIEVLLFIDYAIFRKWWDFSRGNEKETMKNIIFHYAYILNGVDLRYRNIKEFKLGIKFVGVYVAKYPEDSPWSETDTKDYYKGHYYVEADDTLTAFTRWLNDNEEKLPRHDQASMFTGHRVWSGYSSREPTKRNRIIGLGDIGGICDYWRGCLSEDLGEFGSTQTLAHEIGHGLTAPHDSARRTACDNKDQYVMASSPLTLTDINYKNAYHFSPCSVSAIKKFLNSLTANDKNCLLEMNGNETIYTKRQKNPKLPGQIMTPDQQCELIYGRGAYYCGGHVFDTDICRQMPCFAPRYGKCFANADSRAATGTTCGDKKWCRQTECVDDRNAPAASDYCRSGDFKFKFRNNQTCSDIIRNTPWKCYDKDYREPCCKSCEKIKRHKRPECAYGDKFEWCKNLSPSKKSRCYHEKDNCCETCEKPAFTLNIKGCKHGDRATWCSTDASFGRAPICYVKNNSIDTCCETCHKYRDNRNKPGCLWGDSVTWCRTQPRQQCYVPRIRQQCCASTCRREENLKDCKYGDRISGCRDSSCRDPKLLTGCCYTCRHVTGVVTIPPTRRPTPRPTRPPPPPTTSPATMPPRGTGAQCMGKNTQASWCNDPNKVYMCYSSAHQCCTTCKRHWQPVKGCEYGDRASWCKRLDPTQVCRYKAYRDACCNLCSQNPQTTPRPAPVTTARPPPSGCKGDRAQWCNKIGPYDCYYVENTCCSTCQRLVISRTSACRYGDRVSWGKKIVKHQCYSTDVLFYCCDTCERHRENIQGCEFGNKRTDCDRLDCNDASVKASCCKTCRSSFRPRLTTRRPTPAPTQSVTRAPAPGCKDSASWCRTVEFLNCYHQQTRETCCQTCRDKYVAMQDCEWGDKVSWCRNNPKQYCRTDRDKCCWTCR